MEMWRLISHRSSFAGLVNCARLGGVGCNGRYGLHFAGTAKPEQPESVI